MKDRLFSKKTTQARDLRHVNLVDLLSKSKDPAFALIDSASRQTDRTFRRLSWSEMAVKIELEPDVMDEASLLPEVASELVPAMPQEVLLPAEDTPVEAPSARTEVLPPIAARAQEPSHPVSPKLDDAMLQRIREDAYAEGLSAGKAITQSEREAELAAQFAQLQKLTVSLGSEQVFEMDVVARSIEDAVLTLASERIGVALTDMPEPLLMRLDGLLDNLAHLLGTREVFVCPDDIPLLQKCLDTHPNPPLIYLRGDPTMQRGDARLRIGGAEVSDLLRDRATSLLRKSGVAVA